MLNWSIVGKHLPETERPSAIPLVEVRRGGVRRSKCPPPSSKNVSNANFSGQYGLWHALLLLYLYSSYFQFGTVVFVCRIWFWAANSSTSYSSSKVFQWPRDSIYGAIILLGAGGAIVHVISMTMAAYAIGPYTVRGEGGR